MTDRAKLKLRARDADDLAVVSALLQDAIVPAKEMTFLAKDRRFVMVVNRFMWERQPDSPLEPPVAPGHEKKMRGEDASFRETEAQPLYERTHCGVTFDKIKAVKARGMDLEDRSELYDLLSIQPAEGGVLLVFADEAALFLQTKRIRCHLQDLGEPWPTHSRPGHAVEDEDAAG
jgi:hypothetical protein